MRKHITYGLLLIGYLVSVRGAAAQWISFGAKGGGIPFGTAQAAVNDSRWYLVGPSVEFRLPAGFAVEADALYQRVGSTASFILPGPSAGVTNIVDIRSRGNSWQFPFLGKYYFRSRKAGWQPFVGAGYAFGTTWFHQQGTTVGSTQNLVPYPSLQSNYRTGTNLGAMVAAGARYRIGRWAFSPELRYTYWGANPYPQRQNSTALLMGISF